jgi:hypothetical protein
MFFADMKMEIKYLKERVEQLHHIVDALLKKQGFEWKYGDEIIIKERKKK